LEDLAWEKLTEDQMWAKLKEEESLLAEARASLLEEQVQHAMLREEKALLERALEIQKVHIYIYWIAL
jgi:hypothetical protein